MIDRKTVWNKRAHLRAPLLIVICIMAFAQPAKADNKGNGTMTNKTETRNMPDDYWKKKLAPDVYNVTRCSATEPAFDNKYWNNHETGMYRCSNCGQPLFNSQDKFDSGTGWPSFTKPASSTAVEEKADESHGMVRDEIVCKHCGAHLGHVFDDEALQDQPGPTILHQFSFIRF